MADQEITRYDNHVIVRVTAREREGDIASHIASGNGSPVALVGFVVRSSDGHTHQLTRDGSLARVNDSEIFVSISGATPFSVVTVNDVTTRVDHTGRTVLSVVNTEDVLVRFNVGTSQQVVEMPTQSEVASSFAVGQPLFVSLLLLITIVGAICVPSRSHCKSRLQRKHLSHAAK